MARTRNARPDEEGIPEHLKAIMDRAAQNRSPDPEEDELKELPLLWPLMRPELVTMPGKGKSTEPQKLWRSPMLQIWWDATAGNWTVSVKDDVIGVRLVMPARSLLTAIHDAEAALASGKAGYKELEK